MRAGAVNERRADAPEKLRVQVAESELIRDLATDKAKRKLFNKLAEHSRCWPLKLSGCAMAALVRRDHADAGLAQRLDLMTSGECELRPAMAEHQRRVVNRRSGFVEAHANPVRPREFERRHFDHREFSRSLYEFRIRRTHQSMTRFAGIVAASEMRLLAAQSLSADQGA
jgi:hypothetical protein